ncbi:MAG TPA: hypothetical protein VK841_24730 [Polyangiaceae bacterium]|nr:hypothetical protein [Polyangiaceae bacterium]
MRSSGLPTFAARRLPCGRAISVAAAFVALAAGTCTVAGCKNGDHAHIATYVRPPVPAGFADQAARGFRIATPSTWRASSRSEAHDDAGVWSLVDPQPAGEFHANVNVVNEPFPGDSYTYSKATLEELKRDVRAEVETSREEIVDGDPTIVVESRWSPIAPKTVPYRTMQANLASRGTGYVVTCAVSAEAFERYRSTCDAIIRSFAVSR